ncbi:UvrD-helicase domain-containing protein [Pseudonocardia sp. EC080619-01]|uniref:UvrD-helicase domain-containing protein n=1 Tax=Pseudonocardia sp. EC080619-01 TaxID=1096856 RepID=UPI0011AEBA6A|nr:UvrD-helicase domain-containing protein [Pseudonocardia sp. EC080619-01]
MTGRRADPEHDAVCASSAVHRVVVAPPGTGKTHLAVRLAGELTATLPLPPVPDTTIGARVLLLTFSNQARSQLDREAARQLDPLARRRVLVSNYHSLFWGAVRAHRRALGLPPRLQIVSTRRRAAALAVAAPAAMEALKRRKVPLDGLAEHRYPAFQDGRTPPPEELDVLLKGIAVEHRAGRLVFDDLGALFWQLLEEFPALAEGYLARFPVVVADEHQDASALQDAVIRRLAAQTKVIRADPMQLIHGFRGVSGDGLWCRSVDDLTCRWPGRDHDTAAGTADSARSLSR